MSSEPEKADQRLARIALAAGDPTGWFEPLYVEAETGDAVVPWDRDTPNPELPPWLADHPGEGRRALVVGCGLGRDAEVVAAAGYVTTAFDVSPTGINAARRRYPESTVDYVVADLLAPPQEWHQAFDLVVEIITVQSMPRDVRPAALASLARFIAPGGIAIVGAFAEESINPATWSGPPWPLNRAEIESIAQDGVRLARIDRVRGGEQWWAEFTRNPGA
jgi:SAM-dependent methyltransferase